jgi:hypothetical protein
VLRTLRRVLTIEALIICGLLLIYSTSRVSSNYAMFDFRGGLFNAGLAILHSHSPYQAQFLAHQTAIMQSGGIARGETTATAFSIPVYPAFANLLIVPLSLLLFTVAAVLFTLASVAAMVGGIWRLGVRYWRCLVLTLLSWPFLVGAYLGAVGPFLVLGLGAGVALARARLSRRAGPSLRSWPPRSSPGRSAFGCWLPDATGRWP